MTDYWLTAHWPTPDTDVPFSRHVYVKEGRTRLPKPGDVVFIRQMLEAKVGKGPRVRTVDRHHRGTIVGGFKVPKGSGGIIGVATVDGVLREQRPEDVLFDYGDLPDWRVIPCRDFRPATLPLNDLRRLIRTDVVRGLNLWPMPEDIGSNVLGALRF